VTLHVASGIVFCTAALQVAVAGGRLTDADGVAGAALQVLNARLVILPAVLVQLGPWYERYAAAVGHSVAGVHLQSQSAAGAFRSE
jgi:hypothetical protein